MKIISDKLKLIEIEFNQIHARPFPIISWYRPPNSGVDDVSFQCPRDILKEADEEEKDIILIANANCDLKKPPELKYHEAQIDLF